MAFFDQREVVFKNGGGAGDVGGLALEFERIVEKACFQAEILFQDPDIFVSGPE